MARPRLTTPPRRKLPHEFVLDFLHPIDPVVKPMFGCFALYVGSRIVLVLREKEEETADNGVWVCTRKEHHDALRRELPSMRSIALLGRGVTNWQVLPSSSKDFEKCVRRACELVKQGDPRIGKTTRVSSRVSGSVPRNARMK